MKRFTSKTQKIGEIGEDIAVKFLMKQGFSILERNYTKKQGEIDIIGKKDKKLVFFEVKSVTCENIVSRETFITPYDNLTPQKIDKLKRTVSAYLVENRVPHETEVDMMLCAVWIDINSKQAKVELFPIRV